MSRPSRYLRLLAACVLAMAFAACERDAPPPDEVQARAEGAPGVEPNPQAAPVELKDVMESGDGYIVGISFPRSVDAYPGLASALQAYADAARADLGQALCVRTFLHRSGAKKGEKLLALAGVRNNHPAV